MLATRILSTITISRTAFLSDLAYDDQINFKTYQIFKPGHGHLTPARAITADRSRMAIAHQHTEIQRFEKPTDYISVQRGTSDRLRQVVAERTCVDQILRNVWRSQHPCLQRRRYRSRIWTRTQSPKALGRLLARQSNHPITTDVILFGLQLLVESSEKFTCVPKNAGRHEDCQIGRIQALYNSLETSKKSVY